jgi:citrate synthase
MPDDPYLDAGRAAAELGISVATLYAYVSRGMLRSEAVGGGGRRRRYLREDVERLRTRRAARRDPARGAADALDWGMPVIESAITAVDRGRLFYRGRDAVELSAGRRFEEVAALLWTGELPADGGPAELPREAPAALGAPVWPHRLGAIERCQAALAVAAADPAAWDLREPALWAAGARILALVARGVAGVASAERTVAGTLAHGWGVDAAEGRAALEAALVLCADHELNASAFTARCVASAGSSPYDAVAAALAALKGRRHGGGAARVEALLVEAGTVGPAEAVAGRLRRGEDVPGFGHRLYPAGDPRGAALLALARRVAGEGRELAAVEGLVASAGKLLGERPTLDVGLVALARALALPEGAPLGLFAAGRTAGWVAHVLEEYRRGRLIRPRARYVGVPPSCRGAP